MQTILLCMKTGDFLHTQGRDFPAIWTMPQKVRFFEILFSKFPDYAIMGKAIFGGLRHGKISRCQACRRT